MTIKHYRLIVVGTDGSPLAEPTVARAALAAAREGADLVIVSACAQLPRREEARNPATLGGDARVGQVPGRAAASAALADAVKVATEHDATVVASLLIDGDPAEALLETVRERQAGLLVVGARQDVSLAERLLGTVASDVVRRAPCDVLIVRPATETGDLPVPEGD